MFVVFTVVVQYSTAPHHDAYDTCVLVACGVWRVAENVSKIIFYCFPSCVGMYLASLIFMTASGL